MGEAERCVREVAQACARSGELFEAVVRALMCTVELEDRLARRSRVVTRVRTSLTIAAPPRESEDGRPLLLAFEALGGGVFYVADRGGAAVAEARRGGVEEIEAEVYAPPYRLPASMRLTVERPEAGWIVIAGGLPPRVALPVGEEHVQAVLRLLELRGAKLERSPPPTGALRASYPVSSSWGAGHPHEPPGPTQADGSEGQEPEG